MNVGHLIEPELGERIVRSSLKKGIGLGFSCLLGDVFDFKNASYVAFASDKISGDEVASFSCFLWEI